MTKPKPRTRHDYQECMAYIEKKHGFNDRDYYGYWKKREEHRQLAKQAVQDKFGNISWWTVSPPLYNEEQKAQNIFFEAEIKRLEETEPLPKDLDFWGDILVEGHNISNGSTFTLSDDEDFGDYSDVPEYNDIINWLMDEFAEGEKGKREIDFEVHW